MKNSLATLLLGAAFSVTGCSTAVPGRVSASAENPIVTLGAGAIAIGGGGLPLRYAIDRRTQTCWLDSDHSMAPIDCCALRRVQEAQSFILWENEATCAARGIR